MPDFSIIFFYVIAPIIVVTIIMVVRSSKHKNSQTNNSVQTPKSQLAKKKDEPSSDILETIRKYTEITTNPSGMDQCEKIRICDEMLSEYEWYQSHVNCCDNWLANVNALWNAVCSYDLYYEGSEYEYSLMSNLFLMIQEKKRH
jgi:sensor c-di-GMP phosphodiesterase-like protein